MALDVGELVAYLKLDDSQYQRGVAGIRGQLLELKRLLASVPDTRPKVTVSVNEAVAQTQMQGILAQVAELDRSDATVEVKVDTKKASSEVRKFKQDLVAGFTDAAAGAGALMTKAGMLGPALLAVSAAASSAAAGGTAVLGTLGPTAAAGIAVYAGALLAVKSGMLLVKFASSGMSAALAGQKGAMKALTPPARDFVKSLKEMHPAIEGLRRITARNLFAGFGNGVHLLAHIYMPELKVAAAQNASALNHLAMQGARMVASGPWKRDFGTVAHNNAINMGLMGRVGLSLADAARSLFVTAQPLIRMFLLWAVRAAGTVDAMVQAKRASGELAAFWQRAAATAATLGHILGNLAVALFNIFRIGAGGAGAGMLKTLQGITAQFRAWTTSASGISKISTWFATGRANLAAMGRLIHDVTSGLSGMGSGAALAPLIDQIRTQIVPPLLKFLKNASASGALQALVSAVGQLVGVFAQLSGQDSSLKAFAVTLGAVAKAANWIVRNVPGAKKVLGAFFVVAGGAAALRFVGLGGVLRTVGSGMTVLATKVGVATGALDAQDTSLAFNSKAWARQGAASVASGFETARIWLMLKADAAKGAAASAAASAKVAAQWVLMQIRAAASAVRVAAAWVLTTGSAAASAVASMAVAAASVVGGWILMGAQALLGAARVAASWLIAMGPIGLAIAAVVGIVILIVKNWDKIKAATSAAWHWVVTKVKEAAHFMVQVFMNFTLVGLIIKHWSQIKHATSTAWNAVVNFVKSIPGKILAFFLRWTIVGVIITHWTQIKTRTIIIAMSIVAWVRGLPGRIISALASLGSRLASTAGSAFGRMKSQASDKVGDLLGFVRSIPGKVLDAIGNLGGLLFNVGKSIIQGLINGVQHMLGKLVGLLHHVTSLIPKHKGPLSKDMILLRPAGQAIMSGLVSGLDDGTGALISKLQGISARVSVSAPRVGPTVTVAGAGRATGRGGSPIQIDVHDRSGSPRITAADTARTLAFYGG